jgi:hypothetical protein
MASYFLKNSKLFVQNLSDFGSGCEYMRIHAGHKGTFYSSKVEETTRSERPLEVQKISDKKNSSH